MSADTGGRTVVQGSTPHACAPGWEWRDIPETPPGSTPPMSFPAGYSRYGVPPDPWRFPEDTVWECDCGRSWVSRGSVYMNTPGMVFWRPEGRVERWRRRRKVRQS